MTVKPCFFLTVNLRVPSVRRINEANAAMRLTDQLGKVKMLREALKAARTAQSAAKLGYEVALKEFDALVAHTSSPAS